jgi:hypothetical protein
MSDKYIIKNCPCRMELHENDCFGHTGYNNCCACTDCVMKQIVELCKHYRKHSDCGRDCPSFGRFLDKLLALLDIQEIE